MGCSHQGVHFNTVLRSDEHLLSMLGRHHVLSGFRTYRASLKSLSGDLTNQVPSIIDRPIYRDLFCMLKPNKSYLEFLKAHTLFNVYEPFIPDALCNIEGKEVLKPKLTNTFQITHEWRFCKSCMAEDFDNQTMPYFRSAHQLPTVSVCLEHSEHLYLLCNTCHNRDRSMDRIGYPSGINCKACSKGLPITDSYIDEDVSWLHSTLGRLLVGDIKLPNLKQLQAAYRSNLNINDYALDPSTENRRKISIAQKALDNYFDSRLYSAFFSNCDINQGTKKTNTLHLSNIACDQKTIFSPVVHLLLIRMLFCDIDSIPKMN